MRNLLVVLCVVFSVASYGQTNGEKYIKDRKNKCLVLAQNFFPIDSLSISWEGGCKNKMANGEGTLTYYLSNVPVATYHGSVINGSPNGKGKFSATSGVNWSGTFFNGVMNGQGSVVFPDTTKKLEGNFRDGEILNLDEKYLKLLQKNIVSRNDSTNLYVNDRNQTELFYYSLIPEKEVKGVVVLLPGTWDRVEYTLSSNKILCQQAFEKGIAIISLSVNQRLTLGKEPLDFINAAFQDAIQKYKLPKDKFIIGGFSMGGLFSLRYTELAVQDKSKTVVKPAAAFSVDGPTDLESMYHTFEVALERSPNKAEPTYALNEFNKHIGGTPKTNRDNYLYYSTYSYSEKDGGNAKYLANIPVRIYNDVDINWWLENRNTDLYGMNALDQSAMINFLRSIGNKKAEFINAFGKGYRLDGTRHPHSWSIVDADDFIGWANTIVK